MIHYLSGCFNEIMVEAAARQPRLGVLAQPGNAIHRQGHIFGRWGIDCGAFGKAARGNVWSDTDTFDYLGYLTRVAREGSLSNCAFAVCPDVLRFEGGVPIGDAEATWKQSIEIFPLIRQIGFKAALVAQDGITGMDLDWSLFDVLFIGGSDGMKLGHEGWQATQRAKRAGKWVHMGRVNSLKRLRYAQLIGCDSADGTFIGFGPRKNLPKVLDWLAETDTGAIAA